MIFVDSSVWIDYFRGKITLQTNRLDDLLGEQELIVGDIVLTEVLQGFDREPDFNSALKLMNSLDIVQICDRDVALAAARNFRILRAQGITIRKTIDTLIATRCLLNDYSLLYSDRDFDPFVEHLGLVSALDEQG